MTIPKLRIRALATAVLAACLALPAYTCDGYRAPDGELVDAIPAGADSTQFTKAQVPHRPVEELDATAWRNWVNVLAYTWPILLVGARLSTKKERLALGLLISEMAIAPVATWVVWVIGNTGKMAYGSYLALAANLTLLLVAWAEFIQRGRARARG